MNNGESESTEWSMHILPKSGWFDIKFGELWLYRNLIWMFVKRDFVTFYKQTILGPLWFIIQPLFTTMVFTVIFGRVAQISTDGTPPFLFYLAGNVMWGYFAETLQKTSDTFNVNAAVFGKVYFPRLTVPISVVTVNFLQFFIQFTLFAGFYCFFIFKGVPLKPTIWIIALPLLLFQMALLGLGVGILISSLTTKYKDLRFAMGFVIQLWMYATPVVYPLSQLPDWLLPYYVLNPMVSVVECFRLAFLGTSAIEIEQVALGWGMTFLFLFLGVILFSRIEKTFMDTV